MWCSAAPFLNQALVKAAWYVGHGPLRVEHDNPDGRAWLEALRGPLSNASMVECVNQGSASGRAAHPFEEDVAQAELLEDVVANPFDLVAPPGGDWSEPHTRF